MQIRIALAVLIVTCLPGRTIASDWAVAKSWSVTAEEITFVNEELQLSGTLYLPDNDQPLAAVVIPQQAGTDLRSNPLYQQKVRVFNTLGYAAFVYDRRGTGESEGPATRPSYDSLAKDAVAAKQAISRHDSIDASSIGFWGLSQSGWIAMLAANQSNAAFAIVVSSPLTTPEEQMDVATYNYVHLSYGAEAAEKALKVRQVVMTEYFEDRISYAEAQQHIRSIEDEPWFELVQIPSIEEFPEDIASSPWVAWVDERVFNPLAVAEALTVPALFILGGKDIDIPVQRTLDLIETSNVSELVDVVVMPDADHVMRPFKTPDERSEREYIGAELPEYFVTLGAWLISRDKAIH